MRPVKLLDLSLQRSGKWWVRSGGNRVGRDRAEKPSSSMVLDGPVRFGNTFPQPALEAQMPSYGAGIGYGILNSVMWSNSSKEERDWVGGWVKRERS